MPSSADLGSRLESYVDEREERLAALDAALSRGLADAGAGRVTPLEEVSARLLAKYQAMVEAKGE